MVKIDDLVDRLVLNNMCKEEDKEIVSYGLTMGLEVGAMIITIIILGLYFNLVVEGLLFFISFFAIHTYTGGYHSENGVECYFSSTIIMIIFYIAIKFLPIKLMSTIGMVLLIIAISVIIKLSPISTANNTLDNSTRNNFRIKVLINVFIESVLVFLLSILELHIYGFVIAVAIFISSILVLI